MTEDEEMIDALECETTSNLVYYSCRLSYWIFPRTLRQGTVNLKERKVSGMLAYLSLS